MKQKIRQKSGKIEKIFTICVAFLLLFVAVFSAIKLYEIFDGYRQAEIIKNEFQKYNPNRPENEKEETNKIINQSVLDAQALNGDIIGWIALNNTNIDYPFVKSEDNNDYLRTDLYGNYAVAGTIFMDCRCETDFSGFKTIIYGHQMKNGSMFADLRNYRDIDFFNNNQTGSIILPYEKYTIEIFAYMTVDSTSHAYDVDLYCDEDKTSHLNYIKNTAIHYRDIGVTANDKIICLSTCSYEFQNARSVVVGKLIPLS